ncbi:MAG: class I SAM-dependent methyltransferase [Candidatus Margulisiibacteriota bacterium]
MVDKAAQIEYYEKLLSQYGENYRALDWNSPESQRLRYKIFKEIFIYGKKSSGISVLDVGCGFGDFYGFLKAEGILHRNRISYTGYDISPKLLGVARKKYLDAKFELRDILEDRYLPMFDYVFCSGVFNIRTGEVFEHLDFVKEMVYRMYDLANFGVAVNFLSEGMLPSTVANVDRYFYFNPEQVMNFCRYVCSRFILRHDYHPGDFTVYLLK